MATKGIAEMQIGKKGLTEGNLVWLKNAFQSRMVVKVDVLKSAGHTRENVEKIAEEIVNKLGRNYTYRIVGFVISVRKWRKPVR